VLRPLDRRRAAEAIAVAANSQFVRTRIHEAWGLDSTVIYPPVDVEKEATLLGQLPSDYLLGASRFVPYKRLDLVLAASKATGMPAVIAGHGPEESRLRHLSASVDVPVTFVIRPSDALLYALYQRATAYVFPAIEDFGIMPVEAMAAGTPVIAATEGGAAESVSSVNGGVLVQSFDGDELIESFHKSQRIDRIALAGRVRRFSRRRFNAEVAEWVAEGLK